MQDSSTESQPVTEFHVDDCVLKVCSTHRDCCEECRKKIQKDELEISRGEYVFDSSWSDGPLDTYYHLDCFAKRFPHFVAFFKSNVSSPIAGFDELANESDKEKWTRMLSEATAKDGQDASSQSKEYHESQLQSKQLRFIRNTLKGKYSVATCKQVLSLNEQFVPLKTNDILDLLTDTIYYGALEPCPRCQGAVTINVKGAKYKCSFIGVWAVCSYEHELPPRRKMIIPDEIYFPNLPFEIKTDQQPIKLSAIAASTSKTDHVLQDMEFVIVGKTETGRDALKSKIEELGGVVPKKVSQSTVAIISTEAGLKKYSKTENIVNSKRLKIDAVSETFLKDITDLKNTPRTSIKNNIISRLRVRNDAAKRVMERFEKLKIKADEDAESSEDEKEAPKIKLKVKGGGVVDHEIDRYTQNNYHVYKRDDENFTVTLGMVDISLNKNRFVKIQILKKDAGACDYMSEYILLEKTGRIGDRNSTKFNNRYFGNADSCINKFKEIFEKKTGNLWQDRNNFVKKAKLMHPIEEDYYGEENIFFNNEVECTLAEPVKSLVEFIIDFNCLKRAMKDYEVDMKKLPLGKLSERQIQKANQVLTELLAKIKSNALPFELESGSNQFFTLIPQKIGKEGSQILDTEEKIKKKAEMLESLRQMETAYKLYHSSYDPGRNTVDLWYDNLKTDVKVLDASSEEFLMIQKYVSSTHGPTHSNYKLAIRDIFEVSREGEAERFAKFKDLHNKRLLWHGSRSTNFASILINGLQIAPPEVPHTGYMFGKGLYFSDTVSKAANYCKLYSDSDGLVLLCEVALGDMQQLTEARYVDASLLKDHQSVMGKGRVGPWPAHFGVTKDGVAVPYGPLYQENITSALYYNEYIVYDPAQVRIKYLVRFQFNFANQRV